MIRLVISPDKEFRLKFDTTKIERFVDCDMQFVHEQVVETIYEDYLYVFVEPMLKSLEDVPVLDDENMFGKIGAWQEHYYFKRKYKKHHEKEITIMEDTLFKSTPGYGIFLYQYDGKVWLEMNKGFSDSSKYTPFKYYSNPNNYRVFLIEISPERIEQRKKELEKIEEIIRPDWL